MSGREDFLAPCLVSISGREDFLASCLVLIGAREDFLASGRLLMSAAGDSFDFYSVGALLPLWARRVVRS